MFAEERKKRILAALHQQPAVRADLGRAPRVSEACIRRDLAELERTGHLKRTHGGAISARLAAMEPSLTDKEDQYQAEKSVYVDRLFLAATGSTSRRV
jgi:DeoR/GlpR family transcriptional regulator of sugar metabolism